MDDARTAILEELAAGPLSVETLAERTGLTGDAVERHVAALREDGFDVAEREGEYELVEVPEFGGAAVAFGLDAPFDVEYHDAVASTNDRARALAAEGRDEAVVLADEQTGGRGRLDRPWTAPSGGVWLSVLFRPDVAPASVPVYTLAAAVATTRVAREAGVDARIKWPNDVLVHPSDGTDEHQEGSADATDDSASRGGDKLAGVLTEAEASGDGVSWVVVGVGVNANVDAEALVDGATSIRAAAGDVDRRLFTQRLLEEFDALRTDVDAVLPAWREHAATLGQRVRVETSGGDVVGVATDVEFPGTLVVETAEGPVRVSAGDCDHLRPEEG